MARTAPAALSYVPQTWLEWLYSVYPPDTHIHNWRTYSKRLAVQANNNNGDNINLTDLFFCFGVRSYAWKTADGTELAFPYSIQIEGPSEIKWFGDDPGVVAALVSGDGGRGTTSVEIWPAPRELYRETLLNVRLDNSLNPADITVEIALVGFEVRQRSNDTTIVRPAAPSR